MFKFFVYPYKQGSRSAKALANYLGGKVIKRENSRYRPRPNHVVINWGASDCPPFGVPILNLSGPASLCSNKLNFFNYIDETEAADCIPQFWTNPEEINDEDFPIVCRTVLAGHSGAGIVIARSRDELVPAPLYVKYIKKLHEFRVHFVAGDIIAVQRKAKREGVENANWEVRNHQNGFVYVRNGFETPEAVSLCAEAIIEQLDEIGLDFGAIDVIYNQRQGRAWCLEVNTAPGLEGQTVEDYGNAFLGPYNER